MSIAPLSSGSFSSHTSFQMPDAGALGSLATSGGSGASGASGGSQVSSTTMMSFEQAMASGDPMRMLVAMLILNLLNGDTGGDKSKTRDAMAGLLGLAMLGQPGFSMSYTASTSFSQHAAHGAYATQAVQSGSFTAMG
jgi:hypothetical protein